MRAAVCLFWGRWGLPMPYKHDIISLVGEPVTGVWFSTQNNDFLCVCGVDLACAPSIPVCPSWKLQLCMLCGRLSSL